MSRGVIFPFFLLFFSFLLICALFSCPGAVWWSHMLGTHTISSVNHVGPQCLLFTSIYRSFLTQQKMIRIPNKHPLRRARKTDPILRVSWPIFFRDLRWGMHFKKIAIARRRRASPQNYPKRVANWFGQHSTWSVCSSFSRSVCVWKEKKIYIYKEVYEKRQRC